MPLIKRRAKKVEDPYERAMALLLEDLSEEQRHTLRTYRSFEVISYDNRRVYRITLYGTEPWTNIVVTLMRGSIPRGWTEERSRIKDSRGKYSRHRPLHFCVHFEEMMPYADHALGFKTILEHRDSERMFLRTANAYNANAMRPYPLEYICINFVHTLVGGRYGRI